VSNAARTRRLPWWVRPAALVVGITAAVLALLALFGYYGLAHKSLETGCVDTIDELPWPGDGLKHLKTQGTVHYAVEGVGVIRGVLFARGQTTEENLRAYTERYALHLRRGDVDVYVGNRAKEFGLLDPGVPITWDVTDLEAYGYANNRRYVDILLDVQSGVFAARVSCR